MIGIYCIKNNINNKVYIGQSINVEKRLYMHENMLNNNQHHNIYFQNAWSKYGGENFQKEVLREVENKEELNKWEVFYIKEYQSADYRYGYNLTEGGDSGLRTPQAIENISIGGRGKNTNLTPDVIEKIKMAMWCGIDRKELTELYPVSNKVLTAISQGINFHYVFPHLNEDLYRAKEKHIKARNNYILEVFDETQSIREVCKVTGYSTSIVEKCVYKYRDSVQQTREKYQDIYDKVHKLKEDKKKNYQIAKILNISPNTVTRYLDGSNNPYKELPYKKITEQDKVQIIKLYNANKKTINELAKMYEVSRNTIENAINHFKYVDTEINMESKESMSS